MLKSESIAALADGYETMIVPFAQKYIAVANGSVISTIKRPRILKPIRMGNYIGLQLCHDGLFLKKEYLHRIIARTFLGEPKHGEECAHLDGNRMNCRLENLRWVTRAENNHHKFAHGTATIGESNPMHKLTCRDVLEMRKMRMFGFCYSKIAEAFGVTAMTAHRAVNKKAWVHI